MATESKVGRAPMSPMATSVIDPDFGAWLKHQRNVRGLTMDEFCALSGLHRTTVTGLENYTRKEAAFSAELFMRLAKGLDMEFGYVLHMAGFDIGREGIDLVRLRRVENIIRAFREAESDLRLALAEASEALDRDPQWAESDLRAHVARGLLATDLFSERLRDEKWMESRIRYAPPSASAQTRTSKIWTEADLDFLKANPTMSHVETARILGRSTDAVRIQRRNLKRESA